MASGILFDIKRYAIHDGPGIRTAVFFKGCPLECWWCHNPEGQKTEAQLMFRANRCKASLDCLTACPKGAIRWENGSITDWALCDNCGKCVEVCFPGARELVGKIMNVDQLVAEISRDIPFYDQSGGGVTFTGGEPMHQFIFLQEVLQAFKQQQIHTALDSCGYAPWSNYEAILPQVDLFLYDVKLMDEQEHLYYTGVSNRQILDNLAKLSDAGAHILVRVPFIPGVNDDIQHLDVLGNFLGQVTHLDGVELMPYHRIGIAKYQSLGMNYRMEGTIPPKREQIEQAEELLLSYDLPVIRQSGGRNE